MPIKGLTDRESLAPRFQRLGKLRKGGPKPERGFGKDLEWFRFVSERPEITKAFYEHYGKAPKVIDGFYLPYSTPEENFDTWREHWVAGGLVHRCDGENTTIIRKDDGSYSHTSTECPGKCSDVGRLSIILPGLLQAGFVGYVVFETHSNHDLRNIMATLFASHDEASKHGNDLQGIPFVLRRYKDTISTPSGKNGKRARREKNLVAIEPQAAWVQTRLELARAEAFIALPAGEVEAEPSVAVVDTATGEILDVVEGVAVELDPETAEDLWPDDLLTAEPELTAHAVSAARCVHFPAKDGDVILGRLDKDQYAKVVKWISLNGNAAAHPDIANAVDVLQRNAGRIISRKKAFETVGIDDEATLEHFENVYNAVAAIAHSFVIMIDDQQHAPLWAKVYRSMRDSDTNATVYEAATGADKSVLAQEANGE